MARKYTMKSGDQKVIRLSNDQIAEMKRRADKAGISQSEVVRRIIEDFLRKGSTYRKPESRSVKLYADADDVLRAEEKARAENGATLGDIIRHALG